MLEEKLVINAFSLPLTTIYIDGSVAEYLLQFGL